LNAEASSFPHIGQDSRSSRLEFVGVKLLPRVDWGVAVVARVVLGLGSRGAVWFLNTDYVDVFRE
jgi:hypothetical protein